ncbi:hypothetical protein J6590_036907 [Homalodisca vitripennis]|nr:hypothetical protein J6590_036907 [Homalodisca vitripennis]
MTFQSVKNSVAPNRRTVAEMITVPAPGGMSLIGISVIVWLALLPAPPAAAGQVRTPDQLMSVCLSAAGVPDVPCRPCRVTDTLIYEGKKCHPIIDRVTKRRQSSDITDDSHKDQQYCADDRGVWQASRGSPTDSHSSPVLVPRRPGLVCDISRQPNVKDIKLDVFGYQLMIELSECRTRPGAGLL